MIHYLSIDCRDGLDLPDFDVQCLDTVGICLGVMSSRRAALACTQPPVRAGDHLFALVQYWVAQIHTLNGPAPAEIFSSMPVSRMASRSITLLSVITAARSRQFSSSRTLPGQSWCHQHAQCGIGQAELTTCWVLTFSTRKRAMSGCLPCRSRNGGRNNGITLRR